MPTVPKFSFWQLLSCIKPTSFPIRSEKIFQHQLACKFTAFTTYYIYLVLYTRQALRIFKISSCIVKFEKAVVCYFTAFKIKNCTHTLHTSKKTKVAKSQIAITWLPQLRNINIALSFHVVTSTTGKHCECCHSTQGYLSCSVIEDISVFTLHPVTSDVVSEKYISKIMHFLFLIERSGTLQEKNKKAARP